MAASAGSSSRLNWLPIAPVVLSTSGVLLYSFLLFGYGRFYGGFHLSAEEVGLGYATTLTRSYGAALFAVVLGFIVASIWRFTLRFSRLIVALIISLLVVTVAVTTVIVSAITISERIHTVKCGIGATPIKAWFLPIFDFRSEPASVRLVSGSNSPAQDLMQHRLVYLGQAQSELVFWDVSKQVAIKLPGSAATTIITAGAPECPR